MRRHALVLAVILCALAVAFLPQGGVTGFSVINVPGDQATIQAAIDAASAGDTIQIANGIYTENITVNKAVNLVGASWSTVLNASSTLKPAVNITASGVNISSLSVRGRDTGATTAIDILILNASNVNITNVNVTRGYNGIFVRNARNITIMNSMINGSSYEGMYLFNVTNITITGSTIQKSGTWGIAISDTVGDVACKDIYIGHNTFISNSAAAIDGGDSGYLLNNTRIDGNTFVVTDTNYPIVDLDRGFFNIIENNNFTATGQNTGIYLANNRNATIRNNTFYGVRTLAVDIDGTDSTYDTVANNTFMNSFTPDGWGYFQVYLEEGGYSTVENNTFDNVTDNGDTTTLYVQTVGNVIRSNNFYNTDTQTIIGLYDDDNKVENNTITFYNTVADCRGIYDDGNANTNISYNTITMGVAAGNDCWGMELYGYGAFLVKGNYIEGFNRGIYAGGGEYTMIYNNTINNSATGIYYDWTDADIVGNRIYSSSTVAILTTGIDTNITGNYFCRNKGAYANTSVPRRVENNTFCVDQLYPADGATLTALTNFSFNVTNPVFYGNSSGKNTSCQLYLDNTLTARNATVFNNNLSFVPYSTSPTAGAHSWYVYCNDSADAKKNYGNSSARTFSFQSADGSACTANTDCIGGFCVHNICRSVSPYCGDTFCDAGETCTVCAGDCGVCPVAATTTGGGSTHGLAVEAKNNIVVSADGNKLELGRGSSEPITIYVENKGSVVMQDVIIDATGLPYGWVTISQKRIDSLGQNERKAIKATINVPDNANLEMYSLVFKAHTFYASAEYPIDVTVTAKCQICPAPSAWSSCLDGVMTRTSYRCDAGTDYACQSWIEEGTCFLPPEIVNNTPLLLVVTALGAVVIGRFYWTPKVTRRSRAAHP